VSPRGRRPAGEDTRGAIIEAARAEFAESGYDATSLRGIARRAGVDPALVHHYFEGKAGIFAETLEIPLDPRVIVERIVDGPLAEVGERLARTFLSAWDAPEGRHRFKALMGAVATHDDAARMLREFVVGEIFGRIIDRLATEHAGLSRERLDQRAALAAGQMLGVALLRYVVELPAAVQATPEELVADLAPVLQMHLASPG
jgi:AcrR family transcriptional regulator